MHSGFNLSEVYSFKGKDHSVQDLEEFGIAPTVVRAKPEYSGERGGVKRERVRFSDGPIPGEPVLKSILEPARYVFHLL